MAKAAKKEAKKEVKRVFTPLHDRILVSPGLKTGQILTSSGDVGYSEHNCSFEVIWIPTKGQYLIEWSNIGHPRNYASIRMTADVNEVRKYSQYLVDYRIAGFPQTSTYKGLQIFQLSVL